MDLPHFQWYSYYDKLKQRDKEASFMKKIQKCYAVLTASAVLVIGSAFTAAASEWTNENGEWAYKNNSGEYVKDSWQDDGNNTYYLGSDGYMVRSTLLEINDSYYYVNSSGAMVKNEWRLLDNASWQSASVEDSNWYYFDERGRALRSKDGKASVQTIKEKKYIFDEYGRMLTGWISESGEALTEDDAWQQALYYADAEEDGDGSLITNNWLYTSVHDEDNEDDSDPSYWFYFSAAGKKSTSEQKTINAKKYYFNEYGAAQTGWVHEDDDWHFYGDDEDCSLRTGWFEAVPDEDLHGEAHSDGTSYWFYASSKGDLTTGQIKTISGKSYGFNEYGELLKGLYKLKTDEKKIEAYEEINSEDDLPKEDDNEWGVYFFNENSGELKTGNQTVDLDGENHAYSFKSSGSDKGRGINGIDGNYIYIHGKKMKAESGTKYQVVNYNGKEYLVSTNGTLAKKKTNVTDSDGIYYCTGSNGEVIYSGSDKYQK